jgi:hypothetical protein
MSGDSIRKKIPLTVKEVREFLNNQDEEYDNDYFQLDEHGDYLVYGIHVNGFRGKGPESVIFSRGPNVYWKEQCECCGSWQSKLYMERRRNNVNHES